MEVLTDPALVRERCQAWLRRNVIVGLVPTMLRPLAESLAGFVTRGEAGLQRHFVEVCRRWETIVGVETAALVRPLGHRRRELLLGTEDPVAMQEMVFMAPEIVSLVNKALGKDVFDKVRFDLIGSRVSLDALRAEPPRFSVPPQPCPERLGGLVGRLDPDTPVGRCYAKYVAYFKTGAKPSKTRRGRGKQTERDGG